MLARRLMKTRLETQYADVPTEARVVGEVILSTPSSSAIIGYVASRPDGPAFVVELPEDSYEVPVAEVVSALERLARGVSGRSG